MRHREHRGGDHHDGEHRRGRHGRHGHHGERGRHGHFGRGEGRGPGGGGRFFDSEDLRLLILHFLSESPRHGYEIIKLIESQLSGAHTPSPGIVYPTLTMLEEMGHASVATEGTRKSYSITDEGKQELKENQKRAKAILLRMKEIGDRHAQERPLPIMRAMENLRMVLRMRSSEMTKEIEGQVTDIIDDAAKKIERL